MKKTLFVLFLLLTLPMSQTVANKIEIKKFQNATPPILPIDKESRTKYPRHSKSFFKSKQQERPGSLARCMLRSFLSNYAMANLLTAVGVGLLIFTLSNPFALLMWIAIFLQILGLFSFLTLMPSVENQLKNSKRLKREITYYALGAFLWFLLCSFFQITWIGFAFSITWLSITGLILLITLLTILEF